MLPKPVIGFAAFSGTGKTTLLEQIIPLLVEQGIRVALIKHAHHDFDIDVPGKDSYRLRKAGATQTLVASGKRWALIQENPTPTPDPELHALLAELNPSLLDVVLVEGFKHQSLPRIELHRPSLGHPLLYPQDDNIIAVASDEALVLPENIVALDLNSPTLITEFIINYLQLSTHRNKP